MLKTYLQKELLWIWRDCIACKQRENNIFNLLQCYSLLYWTMLHQQDQPSNLKQPVCPSLTQRLSHPDWPLLPGFTVTRQIDPRPYHFIMQGVDLNSNLFWKITITFTVVRFFFLWPPSATTCGRLLFRCLLRWLLVSFDFTTCCLICQNKR